MCLPTRFTDLYSNFYLNLIFLLFTFPQQEAAVREHAGAAAHLRATEQCSQEEVGGVAAAERGVYPGGGGQGETAAVCPGASKRRTGRLLSAIFDAVFPELCEKIARQGW